MSDFTQTPQGNRTYRSSQSGASRRLWLTALVVGGMLMLAIPTPARAHDGQFIVGLGDNNHQISNWDYRAADWVQEDWPVHVIFWNNAWVDKVKGTDGSHELDNDVFQALGGNKWLWWNRNFAQGWDADKGRKIDNCDPIGGAPGWVQHYRVYGDPSDDRLWAPGWSFYVPMTTHYDFDDPSIAGICNNRQHGWDEQAADWVQWYYREHPSGPGWGDVNDWAHFHNAANGVEMIGGIAHTRTSDGLVSIVWTP